MLRFRKPVPQQANKASVCSASYPTHFQIMSLIKQWSKLRRRLNGDDGQYERTRFRKNKGRIKKSQEELLAWQWKTEIIVYSWFSFLPSGFIKADVRIVVWFSCLMHGWLRCVLSPAHTLLSSPLPFSYHPVDLVTERQKYRVFFATDGLLWFIYLFFGYSPNISARHELFGRYWSEH